MTLKDDRIDNTAALARHLGLSRWTVSRVINGHPGVREATRKRVETAMLELGFSPNPMARGLRGQRTHLVGICLHELDNPVLSGKAMALQRFLRSRGYQALLELTNSERALEAVVLQSFRSLKVDGIILVASRLRKNDPLLNELVTNGMPIVALDPFHDLPLSTVRLNRREALRELVQVFLNKGHTHITLAGISNRSEYGQDRMAGIHEALSENGLDLKTSLAVFEKSPSLGYSVTAGFELAERLLAQETLPQAIIAANDRIAMGIMQRFRSAGKLAPRDYSIAGFDNLEAGLCTQPALTTIDQQVDTLIEATVEQLLNRIEPESITLSDTPPQQLIDALLVSRESIASPRS
jgi:DNA-binding LacI/PurR family transcriptional regulator